MWAGQAMELSESDFAVREWVADSGLAIVSDAARALLSPRRAVDAPAGVHVRRARLAAGAADAAVGRRNRAALFDLQPGAELRQRAPRRACPHGQRDRRATRQRDLAVDERGRRPRRSDRARVAQRPLWLGTCPQVRDRCGGVETPRLLLASNGPGTRGVGNERDLVGRFFAEHVHVKLPVIGADRRALARLFTAGG